jgi:CheY-like chemotaxis protein
MKGEKYMSVLLVDDVYMFIEIQKEFLQDSQVDILTAKDGQEALNVIKNGRRPDVVFMDLHMPKMDGAACCRAIKTDPNLARVNVVMITAMGKVEDKQNCISAGCDDFLTKPLDRNIYLETARRFIPDIDRREKRMPIQVDAVLSAKGESLECTLHDVSTGGAFVASDYQATPREVIQIYFIMPDGTRIMCPGRVAWVNGNNSKFPNGFGVQFALLPKHAKEVLTRFTEST